ncbi:MAG: type II toxin-antitoxin system RelE/ParE family toxin [Gallionella sp.]|nr:type II toxin-antitoxin system RelE/ParE family toxin [Gallionella sp.]
MPFVFWLQYDFATEPKNIRRFLINKKGGLPDGESILQIDKVNYNPLHVNTIAELPAYLAFAEKHLSDEERQGIIDYLAEYPKAGDVMCGTGGVRKLRWGKGGRGKSGGVRVIYYFHDERLPLYLLTLFAKNEQANLTMKERNLLANLVDTLVATALEKKP